MNGSYRCLCLPRQKQNHKKIRLKCYLAISSNRQEEPEEPEMINASVQKRRKQVKEQLAAGKLENEMIEIEVEDTPLPCWICFPVKAMKVWA